MKRIEFTPCRAAAALLALALLWVASPAQAADPTVPSPPEGMDANWQSGRNWISVRVGYAKSLVTDAPHGSFGGGIGFNHMLTKTKIYKWTVFKQWSLGGYVHVEHLGNFGASSVMEIPVTVEFVRHFKMGTPLLRPYAGFGGGAFYRKLYRTGSDLSVTRPAGYFVFGANTPIDHNNVLGLDFRFIQVDASNEPPNPVFGAGDPTAGRWSLKLGYSLTY